MAENPTLLHELNSLLAYLAYDQRSFAEIANYWSKIAREPPETMLCALVSAFWRGEFERDGKSMVFALLPPNSVHTERSPGNYAFSDGNVVKVGKDLCSYVTAEREMHQLFRRQVAGALSAMSECIPWPWDGSDDGLVGFSIIPWQKWPPDMRRCWYSEWRTRREDFVEWYSTSRLHFTAPIEQFWPPRPNRYDDHEHRSDPTSKSADTAPKVPAADMMSARGRGRRPVKLEHTTTEMRKDIEKKQYSLQDLRGMLEKELAARYGVSRDTARKARNAILSENGCDVNSQQKATNDK
jgi:hypothetical protein